MFKWLKSLFIKRKVLVHTPTGDLILEVSENELIRVPWGFGTCPFHLEPDGRVTLRLIYSNTIAAGYGEIWPDITWEELTSNQTQG